MESNDAARDTSMSAPRQRSPQHPAFALPEAIEKARKLMEEENAALVPASVALQHWGYSAKSSSGLRTIATMLEYGLVDDQGAGSDKKLRASERARLLVRHPDRSSGEYLAALKSAALAPASFKAVYEAYPDGLPTDSTLAWELERQWGFVPGAISGFIAALRESFDLAKLYSADKVDDRSEQKPAFSGVLDRNDSMRRTDSSTQKGTMNEEVFTLSEGVVVLRWPSQLSASSFDDFRDWLDLIKRKAARASGVNEKPAAAPVAPASDQDEKIE